MSSRSEEVRARRREEKAKTCKHWKGILSQPPCGAGVDLIARVGPRRESGWALKVPCTPNEAPAFECECKEVKTAEEVAAEEEALASAFGHTMTVMKAIPNDKTILSGEVACPKCGGTVRWQRSAYNGHRRAACERGCVSFIE